MDTLARTTFPALEADVEGESRGLPVRRGRVLVLDVPITRGELGRETRAEEFVREPSLAREWVLLPDEIRAPDLAAATVLVQIHDVREYPCMRVLDLRQGRLLATLPRAESGEGFMLGGSEYGVVEFIEAMPTPWRSLHSR